jgi:ArsR family transcriptional regulator
MDWSESDIRRNRDYFLSKLHAITARADVVEAIEHGPFDFVLLDTRGRESFAFGHITGAWCAPLEELGAIISRLPKDREIVTYCWGHD